MINNMYNNNEERNIYICASGYVHEKEQLEKEGSMCGKPNKQLTAIEGLFPCGQTICVVYGPANFCSRKQIIIIQHLENIK